MCWCRPCDLHTFLHDYVEQNFLERVRFEYMEKMTGCAKRESPGHVLYLCYCVYCGMQLKLVR